MSEPTAPRIGITWITPGLDTSERYINAVRMAGGEPVPLLSSAASWDDELPALQGLLLTGGADIDPQYYGEENRGSRGIIPQRDRLEFEALRYSLDRGLPVLAICRGIQLLNVGLGGSLVQDIESRIEHESIDGVSSYHTAEILPGTLLSSLVDNQRRLRLNSRHHQGMKASHLAEGLVANCLAPDGIIEGVEAPGEQFIVGVQCHPERADETPELFPVFRAFISRAASPR